MDDGRFHRMNAVSQLDVFAMRAQKQEERFGENEHR
jgi:hypothetical protein